MKNKIIGLLTEVTAFGTLAALGCLLSIGPLYGQEQLLKEYIYLDERLLAIERQPTPAFAQKPATVEDKDLNALLPIDGSLMAAFLPETAFPNSQESLEESVASEPVQGAPASWPAPASSPAFAAGQSQTERRIQ